MTDTGYKDRNGNAIYEGMLLKWIRDATYYKSGAKAGQVKESASEFVGGRVVKLTPEQIARDVTGGSIWWCKSLNADPDDDGIPVPQGIGFAGMLQYIEIMPEGAGE